MTRPARLSGFDYRGFHRYFITCCTAARARLFVQPAFVDPVLAQFLQHARMHDFAVLAYCFMPDHLHLLLEGVSKAADLVRFMNAVRQRTGFDCARAHGTRLWQAGYYEHVLRDDETSIAAARYIVENPVRAGLVASPREYPYSGTVDGDVVSLFQHEARRG